MVSPSTLLSSTNKSDCNDITEILLTVALITIEPTNQSKICFILAGEIALRHETRYIYLLILCPLRETDKNIYPNFFPLIFCSYKMIYNLFFHKLPFVSTLVHPWLFNWSVLLIFLFSVLYFLLYSSSFRVLCADLPLSFDCSFLIAPFGFLVHVFN